MVGLEWNLYLLVGIIDLTRLSRRTWAGGLSQPVQATWKRFLIEAVRQFHFLQATMLWSTIFEPPISVLNFIDRLTFLCIFLAPLTSIVLFRARFVRFVLYLIVLTVFSTSDLIIKHVL